MQPNRPTQAARGFLVMVVIAGAALAQTGAAPAQRTKDVRALEREIDRKEQTVGKYDSALRKLESAGRQTSHSGVRSAVEDIETLMADVIVQEEDKFGEEHVITQHGKGVETVHTNELTESRGVRTRSRDRVLTGQTMPPAYVRLMRLQDIYVACQTLREHAVARQGEAPDRYLALAREFGEIMRTDLAELRAELPEPPPAPELKPAKEPDPALTPANTGK